MRQQGTLKQWNAEKGYGFIRPDDGSKDIFIHISKFPKKDQLPKIGERIRYDVTISKTGKPEAFAIERLDVLPVPIHYPSRGKSFKPSSSLNNQFSDVLSLAIGLIIVATLGYILYGAYHRYQLASQPENTAIQSVIPDIPAITQPSVQFSCDGRQHCSQMHSYDEAVYFINHCPNTKMDGDHDGIPCEEQFGRH